VKTNILETWYGRTAFIQRIQYLAALHYSRLHYWLGVPVIVVTTLVGTSVFASIQQQPAVWIQVLAGFASVVAAILAGLQTFLGLQDRAEKHRLAGAKYGAVGRELEELLAFPETQSDVHVSDIRQRLDALALESPNVPLFIANRATRQDEYHRHLKGPVDVGPATSKVERP
jgi:hypothetical protein